MLGVVLLSEYNEMIHAFGNAEFRQHFFGHQKQQQQCTYSEEERGHVSSSSGVCSSPLSSPASLQPFNNKNALNSPTNTCNNMKNGTPDQQQQQQQQNACSSTTTNIEFRKVSDEHNNLLNESLLLQQLMPLVALCRTKCNQSGDIGQQQIQCIQAGNTLSVHIRTLQFSNLLVLISGENSLPTDQSSAQLFRTILRCIEFHYGPRLQLIPLAFSPLVQQLHKRCEHRMLSLLYAKKGKDKKFLRTAANDSMDNKIESPSPPVQFAEMENPNGIQHEMAESFSTDDDNKFMENIGDDEFVPFCQNIFFGGTQHFVQWALMPKLRKLVKLISQRIGRRCRCLFLHSGQLIASAGSNSPSESTLTCFLPAQLQSILQFSPKPDPTDDNPGGLRRPQRRGGFLPKCHTEQTWLYSNTLRRSQLHNVFVLSLNEQTEIVVIALAEQSQLICHVNQALELLEQIGGYEYPMANINIAEEDDEHLLNKLMDKCQHHLECVQKLLLYTFGVQNLQKMGEGLLLLLHNTHWDYLENVARTCNLINQIWNHFRTSVHMFHHERSLSRSSSILDLEDFGDSSQTLHFHDASINGRSSSVQQQQQHIYRRQPTISSIYSTMGEEGHSASLSASFSTGTRSFSALELIKTQLKKLLRALFLELLALSSGLARSQTLPLIHVTIRHQMVGAQHQLANTLGVLEDEIARRWMHGNPLRPACLHLDMHAYRFTCVDAAGGAQLHFHYTADSVTDLFARLVDSLTELHSESSGNDFNEDGGGDGDEMIMARTLDNKLILQLSGNSTDVYGGIARRGGGHHKLLPKFFGSFSKKGVSSRKSAAGYHYRCVCLFPSHVNIALAMKQSQSLIEILVREMDECHQSFNDFIGTNWTNNSQ